MDPRVAANRALWNEWTPIHVRSAFFDVEGWKSGWRADLYPLLVSEVGDVAGKDLLHLQCHFGLDTLAWAWRGARTPTPPWRSRMFPFMVETEPSSGVWRLPEPDDARLPLLYSLKATKD
jgi:hypothetical protein